MNAEVLELSRQFAEVTRESSLREIADAIIEAAQVSEDGELTPDACVALDALNMTLERKVEAYHYVYAELTTQACASKELAAYYERRAKAPKAAAERLRARLQEEMMRLDRRDIRTPTVKASIEWSTPAVEIENGTPIEAIPAEFVIIDKRVDRTKLLKALKAGATYAFARVTRGTHLRFR